MGRIERGINGPLSGKVGPVVGSKWKDIYYIRSLPKKSGIRTEKQKTNQGRFAFVNTKLKPFKPMTSICLMNYSGRMTAYNAAYRLNHRFIPDQTEADAAMDYSLLILSAGELPEIRDAVLFRGDGLLRVTWKTATDAKARDNDEILLFIYCPESNDSDILTGGIQRSKGVCEFKYKPQLVGLTAEIYIAFTSVDRKKASPSMHLGSILLS